MPCTEHYCITVTQGLRNSNVHQLYRDHQRISTLLKLCPLSQQQWAFPGCGIACVIVANLLLPTSSLHIGILVCACAVGGLNFMQEGTLSEKTNPPLWVRTHINHIAHSLVPRPPYPSFYSSPWRPFRRKACYTVPHNTGSMYVQTASCSRQSPHVKKPFYKNKIIIIFFQNYILKISHGG